MVEASAVSAAAAFAVLCALTGTVCRSGSRMRGRMRRQRQCRAAGRFFSVRSGSFRFP